MLNLAPDVCCLIADIDEMLASGQLSEEHLSVQNSVMKRQNEFHAGRNLSRLAMQEMGISAVAVPVLENRLPMWPEEVVGSISHTDSLVAVAMAKRSTCIGLGLDIEHLGSIESSIYSQILRLEEQETVMGAELDATRYFSGKEAVFKAVFPSLEEYFDFTDISLEFEGDRFRAVCRTDSLASAKMIESGSGVLMTHGGHIVSLYHVD